MRVRLQDLRFPKPVAAGCNFMVIGSLAHRMRSSNWDPEPILIRREADGGWRITDGRHRVMAAIIAGRRSLPYVEDLSRAADSAKPGRRRG